MVLLRERDGTGRDAVRVVGNEEGNPVVIERGVTAARPRASRPPWWAARPGIRGGSTDHSSAGGTEAEGPESPPLVVRPSFTWCAAPDPRDASTSIAGAFRDERDNDTAIPGRSCRTNQGNRTS